MGTAVAAVMASIQPRMVEPLPASCASTGLPVKISQPRAARKPSCASGRGGRVWVGAGEDAGRQKGVMQLTTVLRVLASGTGVAACASAALRCTSRHMQVRRCLARRGMRKCGAALQAWRQRQRQQRTA